MVSFYIIYLQSAIYLFINLLILQSLKYDASNKLKSGVISKIN